MADGSVAFYLDRWVTTRIAKISSGIEVCTEFNEGNNEHVRRRLKASLQPSGGLIVRDQFHCFVSKVR